MNAAIAAGRSYDYAREWEVLDLRYFTPREILNLHCFPQTYTFPANTTVKQCYKLLGNSINSHVVEMLCRHILRDETLLLDVAFGSSLNKLDAPVVATNLDSSPSQEREEIQPPDAKRIRHDGAEHMPSILSIAPCPNIALCTQTPNTTENGLNS